MNGSAKRTTYHQVLRPCILLQHSQLKYKNGINRFEWTHQMLFRLKILYAMILNGQFTMTFHVCFFFKQKDKKYINWEEDVHYMKSIIPIVPTTIYIIEPPYH